MWLKIKIRFINIKVLYAINLIINSFLKHYSNDTITLLSQSQHKSGTTRTMSCALRKTDCGLIYSTDLTLACENFSRWEVINLTAVTLTTTGFSGERGSLSPASVIYHPSAHTQPGSMIWFELHWALLKV